MIYGDDDELILFEPIILKLGWSHNGEFYSREKERKRKVGLFEWGESGDNAHTVQVMVPKTFCSVLNCSPWRKSLKTDRIWCCHLWSYGMFKNAHLIWWHVKERQYPAALFGVFQFLFLSILLWEKNKL